MRTTTPSSAVFLVDVLKTFEVKVLYVEKNWQLLLLGSSRRVIHK